MKYPPIRQVAGIALATAASSAALYGQATVGTFTGGDPGEGLDMQGNFLYAVNVGPDLTGGRVGDAIFTGDNVAGISVSANNSIAAGGWGAVNYGATLNDQNLS